MTDWMTDMTRYHVGHNIPGYLPEPDVFAADGKSSAVSMLDSDLDALQDYYAQGCPAMGTDPAFQLGSEHCGWCDVYYDVEADRVSISDGDLGYKLAENRSVHLTYSPPEGPDVVCWAVECAVEVDDCEICSDPEYGVETD
jgi:hypothetical protein